MGSKEGQALFKRTVRSMGLRDWVLLAVLSYLVSLCGVLGMSFGMSGTGGAAVIPVFWCVALSFVVMVPVGFIFLVVNAALTKLAYSSLNKDAAFQQEKAREEAPGPAAGADAAPGPAADDGAAQPRPSRLSRILPTLTGKSVALFTAIMIVFWSPYVVATFPGQLYNDTAVQMQQVYAGAHPLDARSGGNIPLDAEAVDDMQGRSEDVQRAQGYRVTDAWLVDHHPFALTLLLGGLASASDALFGNWMPALALLMGVCVVAMAAELTYGVAFLRRKGAPLGVCLAAYLFCCLVPLVPLNATMVMKDTFFALFFIPWFYLLIECVLTKGACLRRGRTVVAFVIIAVLMCLMKKTGVYVVGATALFGLISALLAGRRGRKADAGADARSDARAAAWAFFLQGGICAVLMFVLVPCLVFPALNIQPASKAESLGVLFQQTARVYRDAGAGALTPEEREAVRGVLRETDLEWDYQPMVTDKVKGHYYTESTDEQLAEYLRAYASMGTRFPEAYLSSIVSVASGFLAPVRNEEAMEIAKTYEWELAFEDDRPMLWPLEQTQPLRDAINGFLAAWASVPVLNLPVVAVTYCLWIPALLLFFCLRNRLGAGILFVPIFVVTGFCIIGPAFQLRYGLPDILMALVLLGACVVQAKAVFKARAEKSRSLSEAPVPEGSTEPSKAAAEGVRSEAPAQA